jgi:hypothetical protein
VGQPAGVRQGAAASRDRALLRAARALAVDRVTAEVVQAMAAASLPTLVVKGPAIAQWLYPGGGRSYLDTDLLVPEREFERAGSLLTEMGYSSRSAGWSTVERARQPEATLFVRDHGAGVVRDLVDLHHNLPGLTVPSTVLWDLFSTGPDKLVVAGVDVRVPNRRCTTLHVVLHGVQHDLEGQTAEDLRRAVGALPLGEWLEVRTMAETLGASDVLAVGLRRLEEGAELADLLSLPVIDMDGSLASHWWTAPVGGQALSAWSEASTVTERARRLRSAVLPTPARVRRTSELDLGREIPLAGSYLRWWWKVARSVVPAARFARARKGLR